MVALGADYDIAATPGLEGATEFYSVAGANLLHEILPTFSEGRAVVGVCGAPYKCPPAPSECALMLHDFLTIAGVRSQCEITMVLPLPSPVPPSPDTSKALIAAFAERDIKFMPNRRVAAVNAVRRVASLDDGSELPYDLFLGVPKHRAPAVVEASGMAEAGWVSVNPENAGDQVRECLRHRRYRQHRDAEGRRLRRGRGDGGGYLARLAHSR